MRSFAREHVHLLESRMEPKSKAVPLSLDLKGHLLIAMPGMGDDRFARTVIFICSHSNDGCMGFILNQPVAKPTFPDILEELNLEKEAENLASRDRSIQVHRGGPVEKGRGFVLHSLDYGSQNTVRVGDLAGLTATIDVLRKLCSEKPPENAIMLLGYSGWSGGQLEREIAENGWLTVPATRELLFLNEPQMRYDAALAALGISEATLSASAGHA